MDHQSRLWAALEAFRSHFAPREINGGMHFNYVNLLEAYGVCSIDRWNECWMLNRYKISGRALDRVNLFFCQVIGYIQRGLPACDRQAFAQGLHILNNEKIKRGFDFSDGEEGEESFPITACQSYSGLGFNFWVNVYGDTKSREMSLFLPPWNYQEFISSKASKLRLLCDFSQEQSQVVQPYSLLK